MMATKFNANLTLFASVLLLIAEVRANDVPKFGLNCGGSLGYASTFNIVLGANYKRKIYLEVAPGIWSYPDETKRKNIGLIYFQQNLISYGLGTLFTVDGKRSVVNPGFLLSLDPFKYVFKMSLDLFVAAPIMDSKFENVFNIRIKTLLLDW